MQEKNRAFLDSQRGHYITLTRAGFVQNLTNEVRQQLLDVIREEFNPGYLCCLHCPGDVAEMLRFAFTQYDLKLEEHGKEQKQNTTKGATSRGRARKTAPKH